MSTVTSRARWWRGGLVGACSAAVTTGAHAAAGGGVPGGSSLVVALLVCAATGAAIGGVPLTGRRARPLGVVAALVAAQFLGHLSLVVAGGHHHGAASGLTPSMVAAHVAAAIVLGAAISAVEGAYVVAASVLCWLRLFAAAALRPVAPSLPRPAKVVVARPVLLRAGLGMRAPPAVFAPAA